MLIFDKKYFDSRYHLFYKDESYSWISEFVNDVLVFGNHKYSIFPLMKMYGFDIPNVIDKKYIAMANNLGLLHPNYCKLIGKSYLKRMKFIIPKICEVYKIIREKEYLETYKKTQDFLYSLKPPEVDLLRFNSLKVTHKTYSNLPIQNKKLEQVEYFRAKTKTGRLTVKTGPPVLTMKSEHRNIIKGRQIDFSSMEPRLLLALIGKTVEGDLYDWAAKELNLNADRSFVKVSIISSMYGSKTVPEIARLFALDEWINQLESQVHDDYIESFWGRPIKVGKTRGKHLLALWLQSTATDAALLGFHDLFKNRTDIIPHWVIHDAVIFSGEGKIPEYLNITDDIKLPINLTEL